MSPARGSTFPRGDGEVADDFHLPLHATEDGVGVLVGDRNELRDGDSTLGDDDGLARFVDLIHDLQALGLELASGDGLHGHNNSTMVMRTGHKQLLAELVRIEG